MTRNRNKSKKPPASPAVVPQTTQDEIPEDEQWRIINQTGILNKIPRADEPKSLLEQEAPLANEILDATLYIIPMSSLLLLMDILVHNQYGQQPSVKEIVDRMTPGIPILSVFIFYTKRYKQDPRMQFFLFLLSVFAGPRLMYLLARGGWLTNIRQCPPLATIWVYTMVQLNLAPALLNLLIVGAYVWWKGLKRYLIR
ncbi:hypothetical protein WG66_009946 [Moniliophthora roreri]|nr:hypothetical protein WG66_009946 [Moniliophthora roreri]